MQSSGCVRSIYIDQIMLVGQDQRSLGALIVPNFETLQQWATTQQLELKLPAADSTTEDVDLSSLDNKAIVDLYRSELTREVKNRPGYKTDDRITDFRFISEPFSQANGLMTQTFKIKRPQVRERYQHLIDDIFAN